MIDQIYKLEEFFYIKPASGSLTKIVTQKKALGLSSGNKKKKRQLGKIEKAIYLGTWMEKINIQMS